MTAPQGQCPAWCDIRHEGGRRNHIKILTIDARCWVAAVYSEGFPGIDDPLYAVRVSLTDRESAQLSPRDAMNFALIIQARTTDAHMRRLASAMHRAGELLLPLAEPAADVPVEPSAEG
ncbi:hypothetical protein [Nonomuraea rubra]|uniref:hypothetical protein n=1 Tax=Nonomuraea rubra TaxID=46180 RepID=UPI0033E28892